jgi:hypothetical protein
LPYIKINCTGNIEDWETELRTCKQNHPKEMTLGRYLSKRSKEEIGLPTKISEGENNKSRTEFDYQGQP